MNMPAPDPLASSRLPQPVACDAEFDAGAATFIGGRAVNNDAFVTGPTWFAVADGVGEHSSASQLVIDTLTANPAPTAPAALGEAIGRTHRAIRKFAIERNHSAMASTLVGVTAVGDQIALFNVGDSRCYALLDGALHLLTTDHTVAQELAAAGKIDASEVASHRFRNVLTRSIGGESPEPDIWVMRPTAMRLLLCSDGLSSQLSAQSIGRTLSGIPDPQRAAERLISLGAETRDNMTAVVVDIRPRPRPAAA